LLVESAVLGLVGGVIGVGLAAVGISVVLAIRPESLGGIADVHIDAAVLGFAMATSVGTGLLFGAVPAFTLTDSRLGEALRSLPPDSGKRGRMRSALVVSEVALAFVLLACAGLTARAYVQLERASLGFEPRNLSTFALTAPSSRFPTAESLRSLREKLTVRFSSLPGIASVALGRSVPMDDDYGMTAVKLREAPRPQDRDLTIVVYFPTSPGYMRTMGIPVLSGRDFAVSDSFGAPGVTIIDDVLAKRLFGSEEPVGRWLSNISGSRAFQVVGIVKHVVHFGPGQAETSPYQVYFPIDQTPADDLSDARRLRVVLRTAVPPLTLVRAVQSEMSAIDPEQPIFNLTTMERLAASTLDRERFSVVLLCCFAGLALLLALIGLYGVMAYVVSRRSHEIGIRMALGADAHTVQAMVVRQGLAVASVGLATGAVVAAFVSQFVTSLVSGVKPTDPATYLAVALLLGGVSIAASWLPSRRATRVDPIVALREE
jgi:putative ABC transport system permease protein